MKAAGVTNFLGSSGFLISGSFFGIIGSVLGSTLGSSFLGILCSSLEPE